MEQLIDNRLIVLVGPTRAGKSCFINTITGNNMTIVGDESGESTTKISEVYDNIIDGFPEDEPFSIVDTMGLDDTEESELSDPLILANTTLVISSISNAKNIDPSAILVFESLTNDSNRLDNTLKKLKAVYGEEIKESIIVILNKNPNPHPKRLNKLKAIIDKHEVRYLHWKSGCSETNNIGEIYYSQMSHLHKLISESKTYERHKLDKLIKEFISKGRDILKKTSNEKIMNKIKAFALVGTIGLVALKLINLPSFFVANIATIGYNEILAYLEKNESFLISLAIEERIKEYLKKKEDL